MTTHIPSLTLPAVVFENPAISILLPWLGGTAIGIGVSRRKTEGTYARIKQPPLSPPPWVFGPVWAGLYTLMGYSAYRAWTTGMNSFDPRRVALAKQGATLYTIQLALNFAFTPLFFGLLRPVEASINIAALTGLTTYMTYTWWQVDEIAGWCLTPYIAWLSFATYLATSCGYLNNWSFEPKDKLSDSKSA